MGVLYCASVENLVELLYKANEKGEVFRLSKQSGNFLSKLLVSIATVLMIGVNVLATIGWINGVTTASISDSYPNLFTPAGMTFSIWGIIYLGLLLFTVYQFMPNHQKHTEKQQRILQKVRVTYIISCVVNSIWIFVWQYNLIPAAMIFMVCLLACLIRISLLLYGEDLSITQAFFLRVPFGLYFGWITVAAIANATVLLVSLGWNGGGISPVIWTVAILIIGAVIGLATLIRFGNVGYGLVLIWAYFGIFTQHTSASGFGGKYTVIITTVIVCMVLFFLASVFVLFRGRKQNNMEKNTP